jgi:hypothetical protein
MSVARLQCTERSSCPTLVKEVISPDAESSIDVVSPGRRPRANIVQAGKAVRHSGTTCGQWTWYRKDMPPAPSWLSPDEIPTVPDRVEHDALSRSTPGTRPVNPRMAITLALMRKTSSRQGRCSTSKTSSGSAIESSAETPPSPASHSARWPQANCRNPVCHFSAARGSRGAGGGSWGSAGAGGRWKVMVVGDGRGQTADGSEKWSGVRCLPARGSAPIFPVARSGLVACINLTMLFDAIISTDSMGNERI